ncbi:MAG: aminotransferase class III-fold pyridoxal phosphate-dependent enzyme [Gemmataceae bacterium]|nr:aminotransferase class III-fold pyridoxal phosphate-dependent enzyme [Gemmataceae bacterium]MDW8267159.1 aminotransferase class III-fold pyridoxal phosphate-dependent enzyme [Gemmataceae bacterium]
MGTRPFFLETCELLLREQRPNLLRLYVNPAVVQTCLCLQRAIQATWLRAESETYQTFLANGFEEALSGAIKLARCAAHAHGRPPTGLVLDPTGRLGTFASLSRADGGRIDFVPGLCVVPDLAAAPAEGWGFVLLTEFDREADTRLVQQLLERHGALFVQCVCRPAFAVGDGSAPRLPGPAPDIVIFDESFVMRDVPFAAFTGRRALFDLWNRPGKTTFHSTTFQPNTISTLHFLRCLAADDPRFHGRLAPEFQRIEDEPAHAVELLGRLYSPSLARIIRSAGWTTARVQAEGSAVFVNGQRVFDGVSGVACSVRGHNPPSYVANLERLASAGDAAAAVAERLGQATGLEHLLPAVSGANANETALKLALTAQFPKRYVLALKGGFGGKTLLALTGTWKAQYKENIEPLYPHVVYVDPFAPDALTQIETALSRFPVAVVQLELIQAVGGVRPVPDAVVRHLVERRRAAGYLLLVDEIQTGMFRTGPLSRAIAQGLVPDLLVLGKGTSDMMFPFALVLYNAAVHARLEAAGVDLPRRIAEQYGYEFGYRTVWNVLEHADRLDLPGRVARAGARLEARLRTELRDCRAVRDVRVHGLLVGIELRPIPWVGSKTHLLYSLAMLRHPRFPVLMGYCQYEPNVLKFTPSLTVADADLDAACTTIGEVLRRPWPAVLWSALSQWWRSVRFGRARNEHASQPVGAPPELVAR